LAAATRTVWLARLQAQGLTLRGHRLIKALTAHDGSTYNRDRTNRDPDLEAFPFPFPFPISPGTGGGTEAHSGCGGDASSTESRT